MAWANKNEPYTNPVNNTCGLFEWKTRHSIHRAFECDLMSVWTQFCTFLYIHKTSLQMLDLEQDTNYTSNYMAQLRVHRARKESIPCTEWANK